MIIKYIKPKIKIKKVNALSLLKRITTSDLEENLFAYECHQCGGCGSGSV